MKNKMYSTQLTDFHTVDVNHLIFQTTERENGVKRVRVMIEHPDGTRGDLILSTPKVFSFGLQEHLNENKEVIGHQLPFILWGRKGPSPDETLFIEKINEISEEIKRYILHKMPDTVSEENLVRFNPLYYKMENGEVIQDRAPILFARLNVQRNHEENTTTIRTLFTDEATKDRIDPMKILNQRCVVQGAVKVDSLIISPNSRPRLQLKLFEARVRRLNNKSGFKSLLEPGKVYNKKKN